MLKRCSTCKQLKARTEFSKSKDSKDGLCNVCKPCAKETSRKWYLENKERAIENQRKRNLANPEKIRNTHRKWRQNNLDKWHKIVNKASNAWRVRNPEKACKKNQDWKAKNTERNLQINRNYRACKSGNGGTITEQEWKWLKEFYNFTCLKCGRKEPEIKLTLDHVIPLKLGGKNVIDNAQPLCGSCNSSKGAKEIDYRKLPHDFMARQPELWK